MADITAGHLVFTPATNANGAPYSSFTFQVQDNGGTLNGGVNLDQSANTFTFDVTSVNDEPSGADAIRTILEDGSYTFAAADFTLTDANDSPANTLAAVQITTLPSGGTLQLSGVDVTAGQTISLANIPNLVFTPAANANGAPYSSFTFQVQDNGGTLNGGVNLDQSANTFTINVTSVDDEPAGTDGTVTAAEDVPYLFTSADFGFSDSNDNPVNGFIFVKITTLPALGVLKNNGVAIAAGDVVGVSNGDQLTYTGPLNASGNAFTSFTFQVQDSGSSTAPNVNTDQTPNTMSINVTPVNDAPVFANLGPNPTFTEGGSAVNLDPDNNASVSDVELGGGSYNGTTLTLARHGGANADDVFSSTGPLDLADSNGSGENVSLDGGATFVGTYSNVGDGTFAITFNANANAGTVGTVLRNIVYANASDNPPATVTIDYTLNDGNTGSQGSGGEGIGTGSVTVNITQVNDAPFLLNVSPSASYTLGTPGAVLSSGLVAGDLDAAPPSPNIGLASATVKIATGFFAGDELFVNLPTSGGFFIVDEGAGPVLSNISVQSNVAGQLVLSGTDSPLHYQLVLDAVSYHSTAVDPSNGGADPQRTITWQVSDGLADNTSPNPPPLPETILSFNVAPVVDLDASGAGTGFTTTFTENGAAIPIVDTDVSIVDPDNFAVPSATVVLTNAKPGDSLSIVGTLPGGIDSSIDTSVAGQITVNLTNSASLADYQTALGQIRFSNSSEAPDTTDRDITVTTTDGAADSNVAHATIHVVAVNDAPVATITPVSYSATQNVALSLKNNGLAVSDVDGNSGSETVHLSVTEGVLTVTAGTSGATVNNSGTADVTITGTIAQINALLNTDGASTVTFTDSAVTGDSATLTLAINDNGNTGLGGPLPASDTATINFTNVLHFVGTNDFDGNGKADILWTHEGSAVLWTNGGAAFTEVQVNAHNGPEWSAVGVGHDHSSTGELIWSNGSGGQIAVWQFNGAAVSGAAVLPGHMGAEWHVEGLGDFNGDGNTDVLWRNTSGNVDVWSLNGLSLNSAVLSNGQIGAEWHVAAIGDFYGTGRDAILWENTGGNLQSWSLNGANVVATANVGQIGAEWHVAGVGHFNNSGGGLGQPPNAGSTDIVWVNTNNDVQLWQMTNGVATQFITPVAHDGTEWHLASVNNFAGDANSDLLWLRSDGTANIWQINGNQVQSSIHPGPAGDALVFSAAATNNGTFGTAGTFETASTGPSNAQHGTAGKSTTSFDSGPQGPLNDSGNGVYYVNSAVQKVSDADDSFIVQIPLGALEAPLPSNVVAFDARLADGSPLPPWLHFDPDTGPLSADLPPTLTASVHNGPATALDGKPSPDLITGDANGQLPPTATGPLTIQISGRDVNDNVSILVFTLNVKNSQRPVEMILPSPGDAVGMERTQLRGLDIGPLIDLGDWTPRGARTVDVGDAAPAGRSGLSTQIAASGWRAMHAERLALVDSLARQNAALH